MIKQDGANKVVVKLSATWNCFAEENHDIALGIAL
jgi:hypothetical protein